MLVPMASMSLMAPLINANGATMLQGAGSIGIYATHGSLINAGRCQCFRGWGLCIFAAHGSIINAVGATGTLNQAKNTLTALGIIFQQ